MADPTSPRDVSEIDEGWDDLDLPAEKPADPPARVVSGIVTKPANAYAPATANANANATPTPTPNANATPTAKPIVNAKPTANATSKAAATATAIAPPAPSARAPSKPREHRGALKSAKAAKKAARRAARQADRRARQMNNNRAAQKAAAARATKRSTRETEQADPPAGRSGKKVEKPRAEQREPDPKKASSQTAGIFRMPKRYVETLRQNPLVLVIAAIAVLAALGWFLFARGT